MDPDQAVTADLSEVDIVTKMLQLTHAFESLDCIAVEFRTHWHNHASRTAVARLLRNHDLWRDGTVRDVILFSIIDSEWKTVKLALQQMLTRC